MSTKLIELKDGILVEVEVSDRSVRELSETFAEKVDKTIDNLDQTIIKVARPILSAWKELNKEMVINDAEVELNLGFELEGNVYLAKSSATANLKVTIKLQPK